MATMVRKQVYITRDQEIALKDVAARTGVKESELIREGIELVLGHDDTLARRSSAFERAEALADRVLALGPVEAATRGWTRDELHGR